KLFHTFVKPGIICGRSCQLQPGLGSFGCPTVLPHADHSGSRGATVHAMVTMDVYRAGQDLRGLKQSQGSIGRHAIIAKRQMHISDAVAWLKKKVGRGSSYADGRLAASGAQRGKGRVALQRAARVNGN